MGQDTKFTEMREKYATKTKEAGQRVKDLNAELEAILKREFREGKDLSSEKTKKRKQIEEAEKEYEVASSEQSGAEMYIRTEAREGNITPRDLVADWNTNYRPLVREQIFTPILERMNLAREAYYNALLDLAEERSKYDQRRRNFVSQFSEVRNEDNHLIYPSEMVDHRELPLITEEGLYRVQQYGEFPAGTKRKQTEGDDK
ncbi:hypothetical protein [Caldalkalibacillus mannanilyticus]|uniref:hypothetical protein n=1 Tax=Caldalkalibacillus mannanilyticus TaxID=1418 RepID=UPI0011DE41C5|nr:hypothetical protein [Caldalkalibacillus mannanilyticus]